MDGGLNVAPDLPVGEGAVPWRRVALALSLAVALAAWLRRNTRDPRDEITAEVAAVMAELRIREEQAKVERGAYRDAVNHPAAPSRSLQAFAADLPPSWTELRFAPPVVRARCSYYAIAGAAGHPTGPLAARFGMDPRPDVDWYYLVAACPDQLFFASSLDTRVMALPQ